MVVAHAYAGTGDAKEKNFSPLEDYYDQENGGFVYPIAASASEAPDAGSYNDSAGNIIGHQFTELRRNQQQTFRKLE